MVYRDPEVRAMLAWKMSGSCIALWLYILSFCSGHDEWRLGMQHLEENTGLSEATLWRAHAKLREAGFLVRVRTGRANRWRIPDPDLDGLNTDTWTNVPKSRGVPWSSPEEKRKFFVDNPTYSCG
jgi:hypothetical protein